MSRLLERLADERQPVDVVIGYRIKRRDPFHRLFIAKTYNAIVSVLFGLRVRDIDCAMKVFRREVFEGLRLDTEAPFLSAELLIKLRARGDRIAQVGVNHYPRAAGTNTGASFCRSAHVPRHGEAALGPVDEAGEVLACGAGQGLPQAPGPLARPAFAPSRSTSSEFTNSRKIARRSSSSALIARGAVRLDAGLVEDALVDVDGDPVRTAVAMASDVRESTSVSPPPAARGTCARGRSSCDGVTTTRLTGVEGRDHAHQQVVGQRALGGEALEPHGDRVRLDGPIQMGR